ncbi:MAG: hypothetical protein LBB50_02860 [Oscillospiraceae bacterium]|jgi:hypothetical protein|nr:hypothetical protein [Oscillospiraceae bacterium]
MHLNKVQKKLVAVVAAGLLVLGAAVLLVLLHVSKVPAQGAYAVVYTTEGDAETLRLAVPEGLFALRAGESVRQVFAGEALYYDNKTEDGLALYVCFLGESKSRKSGGRLVAQGVQADWAVSPDGAYAVFVEEKGKVLRGFRAADGTTQELAAALTGFYAAQGQDVAYFTKRITDEEVLFRCVMGRQPMRITGAVEEVHFYADGQRHQLLYLGRAIDGTRTLNTLDPNGNPMQVMEDPQKVFFEDYVVGGNLYILKAGETVKGGTVTLSDPLSAADALVDAPRREDYAQGLLSRYFGDIEYERDLQAYEKKKERDAVRAAVKKAQQNLPDGARQWDCYVFDGKSYDAKSWTSAPLLVSGVSENGLAAKRAKGRPAILFEKTLVVAEGGVQTVTLDAMLALFRSGGADAVTEHLGELTRVSSEPAGYALALMDVPSPLPMEKNFGSATDWTVTFLEVPEMLLYAESDVVGAPRWLFAYDIMENGISERYLIEKQVVQVRNAAVGIYYRTQAEGDGALYYCYKNKGEKLLTGVDTITLSPDRTGLLAQGGTNLRYCEGTQMQNIGQDVLAGSVVMGTGQVCYLAKKDDKGMLYLNTLDGNESRLLDTGAAKILAVR